ncbi:hypothetical protein BRD17_07790 [Halobacteriales archaeon SW_7_68_16]|nr:MAG: hypothetical protein BRD17_07790 [Halobacteriales archaeon SW_7_68_16]
MPDATAAEPSETRLKGAKAVAAVGGLIGVASGFFPWIAGLGTGITGGTMEPRLAIVGGLIGVAGVVFGSRSTGTGILGGIAVAGGGLKAYYDLSNAGFGPFIGNGVYLAILGGLFLFAGSLYVALNTDSSDDGEDESGQAVDSG